MYKKVNRDLFNIVKRLKHINRAYCVYYNGRENRFEVHTVEKNPTSRTIGFIVPYDKLDYRTIEYAFMTRKQNDTQIERDIDTNNEKIIKSVNAQMDLRRIELCEMLEYANRAGHTVDFSKNYIKEF